MDSKSNSLIESVMQELGDSTPEDVFKYYIDHKLDRNLTCPVCKKNDSWGLDQPPPKGYLTGISIQARDNENHFLEQFTPIYSVTCGHCFNRLLFDFVDMFNWWKKEANNGAG